MQRVFLKNIEQDECFLLEEDIYHFKNVLRMKIDEEFEGVFNDKLYLCSIVSISPFASKTKKELPKKGEIDNDISLYFALAKGEKNELVTQKCTELGVNRIIFLSTKRSILKPHNEQNKLDRYYRIALSAAKQSRRMNIPSIEGIFSLDSLNQKDLKNHNFFAYENISGTTESSFNLFKNIKKGESINILIGPEGGFSKEEATFLINLGFIPISLGNRILRSETAAIYVLSNLSFLLERK